AVSWLLTVVIEKPLTNYGRTWAWSGRSRQAYGDIQNAGIAFRANSKLPTGFHDLMTAKIAGISRE
ncbi:MAG: hypothetical protein WAK37_22670, partial [Pseudolabrys sp.]